MCIYICSTLFYSAFILGPKIATCPAPVSLRHMTCHRTRFAHGRCVLPADFHVNPG